MTIEEVKDYVRDRFGAEAEYLWARFPEAFIFRHDNNRKWFAIMMRVPYRTLGLDREGIADILNIKCDPFLAGSMRENPGYLPAYHMNKDKWLTILLDGSADDETILALLAMSFDLTALKRNKQSRHSSDPAATTAPGGNCS